MASLLSGTAPSAVHAHIDLDFDAVTVPDPRIELTVIGIVCSVLGAMLGALLPLMLGRAAGLSGAAVMPTLLCATAGATAFGLFGTLIGWQLSGIPVPFLESGWPEGAANRSLQGR